MLLLLVIIVVLVALNALYVAAEFATVAAKSIRIQAMAEAGNRTAQRLLPHLADASALDRYVAACQIGITASSLFLGAFGQKKLAAYLEPWMASTWGLAAETAASLTATLILFFLTAFQVVLGELLPKALALRFPERISLALTYPMLISLWLYHGFIKFLNGSGNLILKAMGVPLAGHRHVHSPEELQQLVRHGAEGVQLDATERQLMSQVFRFGDHVAHHIMVPRMKVQSLNLSDPLERCLEAMKESGHTRFPVFDGEADRVEGYVHLKDVTRALAAGTVTELKPLMRPAVFAPASLAVDRLFERMRKERAHLMILLDEFGGTAGIVTMEDVLQEVVGEMQDEFGKKTQRVLERQDDGLVVRGNLLLDRLSQETDWTVDPSPADTVGGLVMHELGRPARAGERLQHGSLVFEVLDVAGHRITRVKVSRV